MKRRRFVGSLALALVAVGDTSAADAQGSITVTITGQVARPTRFTVADLAGGDATLRTRDISIGVEGTTPRRYRGVLLRDLVTACRPLEQGRFDLRQSYLVARATDGYLAVFSWAELFNSPLGDQVVVAFERDGAPIAEGEGPIVLVSGGDTRSGPRHVRWLDSIDLRRATP